MAWNRPSAETQQQKPKAKVPSAKRGVIAGAVVVALGALCLYLFSNGEATSSSLQKKERGRIKEIKQATAFKAKESVVATNKSGSCRAPQPRTNGRLPPKLYMPTEEEIAKARLGQDGKSRKMSIYKTPLEQTLGQLFSTEFGAAPPMMVHIPKLTSADQVQKFFETKMEYNKDAPKSINEDRIILQRVQEELKKYLADGGRVEDFVAHYHSQLVDAHNQWKDAQKMILDLYKDGESAQNIKAFKERAENLLSEKGIRGLRLPPRVRAALGE